MTDIARLAAMADGFTTLAMAAKTAGLDHTLQGAGPCTIFAPTDTAFAKLPRGTLEALLSDPVRIAAILRYHVVPGKVQTFDIIASRLIRATTMDGDTLELRFSGGHVYANGARIVEADVPLPNGVIHVIDRVLLPSAQQTVQ